MHFSRKPPGQGAHHWLPLPAGASEAQLPVSLADVTALLEQVGRAGSDAMAEQLLQLLGRHVPLAQCTIFAFHGGASPRIVGLGDRARTGALPLISQDYSQRFYPLDGARRVMKEEMLRLERDPHARPRVWLHRQAASDVAHAEYRHVCYGLPRLVERLSLLGLQQGGRWMAVNLYRGEEHGGFDDQAVARIEAFAPLVMQAVRLHCAGQALQADLPGLVLARLARRHAELTQRDLDVVRAVAEGLDAAALAARLGITLASARTYVKRVCAKLGVQGRRELFALLIEPSEVD
jgi:DNA-binding CsgD family transcriptional regulator